MCSSGSRISTRDLLACCKAQVARERNHRAVVGAQSAWRVEHTTRKRCVERGTESNVCRDAAGHDQPRQACRLHRAATFDDECVDDALRSRNRIDGLIVFAGDPSRAKTADLESAGFQEALDRNTVAPLLLARDAAVVMREQSTRGAIVLVSSMQGTYPFEGSLAYGTSKAALIHGARILAKDFGGRNGVNVNVIAPGVTGAGMARASVDSGKYDAMIERGVISRFGKPEDIARAIRLLIDPESYMTGQVLVVDGGLTLRRDL